MKKREGKKSQNGDEISEMTKKKAKLQEKCDGPRMHTRAHGGYRIQKFFTEPSTKANTQIRKNTTTIKKRIEKKNAIRINQKFFVFENAKIDST